MTQHNNKQDAVRRRKSSKASQPPPETAEEKSPSETSSAEGPVQPLTGEFRELMGFKSNTPGGSGACADPGPSFPDRPIEPFPPLSESQAGPSPSAGPSGFGPAPSGDSSTPSQPADSHIVGKLGSAFSQLFNPAAHGDDKKDDPASGESSTPSQPAGSQIAGNLSSAFSELMSAAKQDIHPTADTAKHPTPSRSKSTQTRRVKPTPVPSEDHHHHHHSASGGHHRAPTTRLDAGAPTPCNVPVSSQGKSTQQESDGLSTTIFARTGTAVEVPTARRSSEPSAPGQASRAPGGGSTWLSNAPTPPPEKAGGDGEKEKEVVEEKGEKVVERKKSGKGKKHGGMK